MSTKFKIWGNSVKKVIFYGLRSFSQRKISISQTMAACELRKTAFVSAWKTLQNILYRQIFSDQYFSNKSDFKVFKALSYIKKLEMLISRKLWQLASSA